MKILIFSLLAILILPFSCSRRFVAPESHSQMELDATIEKSGDTLYVEVNNVIVSPICLVLSSKMEELEQVLFGMDPVIFPSNAKTMFRMGFPDANWEKTDLNFEFAFCSESPQSRINLELPIQRNKRYRIMQGFGGAFSHNTDYSRYSIDFEMPIGDTILAVADGFVVGVIEAYEQSANDSRLRDYANFVTIFHPHLKIYSQYVHVQKNGSLVEVGDSIYRGQQIALSGDVGYVSGAHLHFNVLACKNDFGSLVSIPYDLTGIQGENFTKNSYIDSLGIH